MPRLDRFQRVVIVVRNSGAKKVSGNDEKFVLNCFLNRFQRVL
jgi:hypothetical protein